VQTGIYANELHWIQFNKISFLHANKPSAEHVSNVVIDEESAASVDASSIEVQRLSFFLWLQSQWLGLMMLLAKCRRILVDSSRIMQLFNAHSQ
jgi:hypothetical protein